MAESYDVIGQKQTFYPNAAGQFEQRVEITIKTKPSNVVRFHDFSLDEIRNKDYVHAALDELARSAEDIHTL